MQTDACRNCSNTSFITDTAAGDVICDTCGVVAQDRILDERPMFDARTAAITTTDTSPFSELNAHFNRAFDQRRHQQLVEGRNFLKEHLYRRPCPGITDLIVDYALVLYSNYLDTLRNDVQMVRGDGHRQRILSGCLMHAAAFHHADVEQRAIAAVFEMDIVRLSVGTNLVSRALESNTVLRRVHVPSITGLVHTYATQLSFPRPLRRKALATARKIEAGGRTHRDFKQWRPNSVAAGIIWYALDEAIRTDPGTGYANQNNVETVASVSKTTFLAVHRKLKTFS